MPGSGTAEHFENVVGSYAFSPLRRRRWLGVCGYRFAAKNISYAQTSSQVSPHTSVVSDCLPIAQGTGRAPARAPTPFHRSIRVMISRRGAR